MFLLGDDECLAAYIQASCGLSYIGVYCQMAWPIPASGNLARFVNVLGNLLYMNLCGNCKCDIDADAVVSEANGSTHVLLFDILFYTTWMISHTQAHPAYR